MATLGDLTVTVRYPDHSPADVQLLQAAAESMPFGAEDLADGLREMADRVARMLLTAPAHPSAAEGE